MWLFKSVECFLVLVIPSEICALCGVICPYIDLLVKVLQGIACKREANSEEDLRKVLQFTGILPRVLA